MKKKFILSLVWPMMSEYRAIFGKIWWIAPATIIVVLAQLMEPYVYKLLVESLSGDLSPREAIGVILPVVAIWCGTVLLGIGIELFRNYYCHYYLHRQWANVFGHGLKSFLEKTYGFHLQMNNAEKIKIFDRGVEASYDVTQKMILSVSKSVLLLIGYIGLVIWINWKLTMILLLLTPFLLIGPIYMGNRVHEGQRLVSKLWDQAYSFAGDSIMNILVVKLFHRIDATVAINRSSVISAAVAQAKLSYMWSFLDAFAQGINLFLSLLVLCVALFFYTKNLIGLGDIILFITVANKLATPFLQLETIYRQLVRSTADYSKYQEILDLPSEEDFGTKIFPSTYEYLKFENVSFTYPNTNREVLKKVNIELRRGEKVALVGHTGSGKSTIANLITRFYLPTSGQILIDKTPIQDFTLESYRNIFAAVFQDTTLFNDTLRFNLEFVKEGVTFEEIRSACREASILDFIESLPEGFDTLVGERGLKLSGGEKQRIAIARAILSDPALLILDEATSALDVKTEKLISDGFEKLMNNRTSLIIAHRLSTIKRADRIYLLEHGEVIANGSHHDLYTSSPIYREMVDFQRNGFVE